MTMSWLAPSRELGSATRGGHSSRPIGEYAQLREIDVHNLVVIATDEDAARAQVKRRSTRSPARTRSSAST
jgi:hypothetical protein